MGYYNSSQAKAQNSTAAFFEEHGAKTIKKINVPDILHLTCLGNICWVSKHAYILVPIVI